MVIAILKRGIFAIGLACLLPLGSASAYTISDIPLFLLSRATPNVLLNMSVETPMGGAAYADQPGNPAGCGVGSYAPHRPTVGGGPVGICYIPSHRYLGYFDSQKCYVYVNDPATGGHFEPSGPTGANHTCSSKWSGNFLNWATMTAIDMFVWTMTGGNRVVDTEQVTVIERARKQNNDSWFPHKLLNATRNVVPSSVTPYSDPSIYIQNTDWQVRIGTTRGGAQKGTFNVKVKVCDPSKGLEANCKAYGTNYKPEGLIQKYADNMRFGVMSYLNDNSQSRDGGVLRSKMKHVGPTYASGTATIDNPGKEFLATTGQLVHNPDAAPSPYNSGVINYINKFSKAGYKSYDPIGELFYESIRYFKNLGPTPEYHAGWPSYAGGFNVVTAWDDPIQYGCQKNFIVAINDANPWLDKRLPGTYFTCSKAGTPGLPGTFLAGDCGPPSNADADINVTALTNRVGELEGLNGTVWSSSGSWTSGTASGTNDSVGYVAGVTSGAGSCTTKAVTRLGEVMGTCPFAGKENSYYIAGLAYYANTRDIRSDMPGKQTVSTFMIDTQEYSTNPLDGPKNMLWLAGKYGGFKDSNGDGNPNVSTTTPTAEWDADGDGVPDNYVLASSPQRLVDALARAFKEIFIRTSSAAAITSNSTRLTTDTLLFQARFNSGDWTGRLTAFRINVDGTLGSPVWEATDAGKIPAHAARNIYTWSGTAGIAFTQSDLTAAGLWPSIGSAALLDYLRGDDSAEQKNGGAWRNRSTRLGDIVNSDPAFVAAENFGYANLPEGLATGPTPYRSFVTAKQSRRKMLYVGANDGMLHAFDALTGEERFAFVPQAVIPNLAQLAQLTYAHRYYVDGSPTAWDAFVGGSWKTLLVGTTGAGAKSVFALDVTNPDAFDASKVLWEINSTTAARAGDAVDPTYAADLGFMLGQAVVVKLANGEWGAVFGNGYRSASERAVLYIVRAADGTLIRKIDTGVGSSAAPNGLGTPTLHDANGDGVYEYAYAADMRGNVWKFDLTSSTASAWKIAFAPASGFPNGAPLFQARNASGQVQPIQPRVELAQPPLGVPGVIVLFGTGRFFTTTDNIDTTTQSFYGILDNGTPVATTDRSQLQQQTITSTSVNFRGVTTDLRDVSTHTVNWSTRRGWYMDLPASGERVIGSAVVRAGRVIFTTLIPSTDPCNFGGTGWLMEVDAKTGAKLPYTVFDTNGDGLVNDNDTLVAGVPLGVGIVKQPLVLEGSPTAQKVMSGTSGNIQIERNRTFNRLGRDAWREVNR